MPEDTTPGLAGAYLCPHRAQAAGGSTRDPLFLLSPVLRLALQVWRERAQDAWRRCVFRPGPTRLWLRVFVLRSDPGHVPSDRALRCVHCMKSTRCGWRESGCMYDDASRNASLLLHFIMCTTAHLTPHHTARAHPDAAQMRTYSQPISRTAIMSRV